MTLRRLLIIFYAVVLLTGVVGLLLRFRVLRTQIRVEVEDRNKDQTRIFSLEGGPFESGQVPVSGSPPEISFETIRLMERYDSQAISQAAGRFNGGSPGAVVSTVDRYEVEIESTWDGRDEVVSLKMQIFVPHSNDSQSPVFIFGSGTTGLADRCAPSRENPTIANWGDYRSHLVAQAAQDYIVVFPDYEGFNTLEKTQLYFSLESEAGVMASALETIRLVPKTTIPATPDWDHVFLSGYSQGGHAAVALAAQPQLINPQAKIAGVITYAGANDVGALLQDRPQLAPYIVESYRQLYGSRIEAEKILQDRWLAELTKQAGEWCIDEVFQKYPVVAGEVYTPEFARALETNRISEITPQFAQEVANNSQLASLQDIPLLMLQGATDPIVTARTQRENRKVMCQTGATVWYQEYPGVNHFQTRSAGFKDTVIWMNGIVSGSASASNCQEPF